MLTLLLQQPLSIDLTQQATAQELSGSTTTFGQYISSIMSGIMLIAALLLLLYLVWGAVEWITSGGDSSKVEKARSKMSQAVIGIIVLSASLAIFGLVQEFLGLDYFKIGSGAPNTSPDGRYEVVSRPGENAQVGGSASGVNASSGTQPTLADQIRAFINNN